MTDIIRRKVHDCIAFARMRGDDAEELLRLCTGPEEALDIAKLGALLARIP